MLHMTFRNIEGILNTVFWIDSSVSSTARNTEFCALVQHLNPFTMLKLPVFLLFRIFSIHIANLSSSNAGTKLLPCTYNYRRNVCTALMGCTKNKCIIALSVPSVVLFCKAVVVPLCTLIAYCIVWRERSASKLLPGDFICLGMFVWFRKKFGDLRKKRAQVFTKTNESETGTISCSHLVQKKL